jgi:Lrp/AsnC family transcriptional regulator
MAAACGRGFGVACGRRPQMKRNKILHLAEMGFQGRRKTYIHSRIYNVRLATQAKPMDAIDRKILAVLQEDASLSVAEIGSRVGLSSTPCWKRIQRLEADGVIQKRVAVIDQDKLGLGVTVFVSVETEDHSEEWLTRFAQIVGAMPEVLEFYRMAGDVDYMLRVVVRDIAGYDAFYKQLIAAVPLKNVTSRFAMEKIKSTTALPIL